MYIPNDVKGEIVLEDKTLLSNSISQTFVFNKRYNTELTLSRPIMYVVLVPKLLLAACGIFLL